MHRSFEESARNIDSQMLKFDEETQAACDKQLLTVDGTLISGCSDEIALAKKGNSLKLLISSKFFMFFLRIFLVATGFGRKTPTISHETNEFPRVPWRLNSKLDRKPWRRRIKSCRSPLIPRQRRHFYFRAMPFFLLSHEATTGLIVGIIIDSRLRQTCEVSELSYQTEQHFEQLEQTVEQKDGERLTDLSFPTHHVQNYVETEKLS